MITYLASAYSHPDPAIREQRFREVCQCAASLFKNGVMVFSPIAHSHPIAVNYDMGTDFTTWSKYDSEMISKCDAFAIVKVCGDWLASNGVLRELLHWNSRCIKSKIKIFNIDGEVTGFIDCQDYIEQVINFWKIKSL